MMILQFLGIFWTQMGVLSRVLYCFNLNLTSLPVPGLLIFMFTWFCSDLAVVLHLRQLAIATHGKVFSVKFEEVPSDLLPYSSSTFYAPVLI